MAEDGSFPFAEGRSAIAFEGVRIGFDGGEILRGVSFCVRQRETVVLLGETGTGKTLTLKMAAGLLKPDRGTIDVLGQKVSEMAESDLLAFRRTIGFMFQEGALFDSMTVADNVAYRLHEDGVRPVLQVALEFVLVHLLAAMVLVAPKKKLPIDPDLPPVLAAESQFDIALPSRGRSLTAHPSFSMTRRQRDWIR